MGTVALVSMSIVAVAGLLLREGWRSGPFHPALPRLIVKISGAARSINFAGVLRSVGRRLIHMVDYEHVDGAPSRLQF